MNNSIRNKTIVFISLVVVSIVAGCTSALSPEPSRAITEQPTISITASPQVATEQVTGSNDVQPTPRSGLEATDPSTVRLASGKLQFVEFFAFW